MTLSDPAAIDPSDAVGNDMLRVARQVLDAPDLAMTDDFFEAGMTSLTALKLADEFSEMLGRVVEVADIYHAASVDRVERLSTAAAIPAEPGALGISRTQQRFWLAEELNPGAADNLIVLAYVVSGPLRPSLLHRAFAGMVARHPVLRTRYRQQGIDVVPEVMPVEVAAITVDIVAPPARTTDPHVLAESITADWWDTPFDLSRQAPVRARLCSISATTHLFCIQVHHIAFDGSSERLFIDGLGALYRSYLEGAPDDVSPAITSASIDQVLRETAAPIDAAGVEFWRRMLADVPPPVLPAPADPAEEADRRELVRHLPPPLVSALSLAARQRRAPVIATLLAATARAFGKVFGAGGTCLGAITEGHARADVIGCFVNPLAVPLDAVGDRDDAELLDHAVSRFLPALRYSGIPFDELVRQLKPQRGRHPWFQTLVVVQYEKPHGELAPGLSIRSVPIRQPKTAMEFLVQAIPGPDGAWALRLAWRADGCSDAEAGAVGDELCSALERLAGL
ncbi:condensation domain-containing protein [Actinoplanes sp. NPDC020271]|uniref:condensation domain-containing protein n=1 Tax=Actinoplanes sp. NPDC020271 TaxID=3363896 RepID=UPI003788275B